MADRSTGLIPKLMGQNGISVSTIVIPGAVKPRQEKLFPSSGRNSPARPVLPTGAASLLGRRRLHALLLALPEPRAALPCPGWGPPARAAAWAVGSRRWSLGGKGDPEGDGGEGPGARAQKGVWHEESWDDRKKDDSVKLKAFVKDCDLLQDKSNMIVIRAKISSEKVVPASDDPVDTHKMIRYEIKQIKMFKGFEKLKDVQYVYTPFDSSLCGVKLEANNKKQYLLTGQILHDGKVLIHLCNYIESWDDLSLSQKKSLNQRYQMGCGCKITTCYMVPCSITTPNECLWTDWLIERKLYGHQAKHYACIKRSDGTCSWYRGGPPPEKEFTDISEP